MFKLSSFVSALAGISVAQVVTSKESFVRITGFRTYYFVKEMDALFKTSRLSKYMFRKVSAGYIEIPAFFVLEFDKVLTELRSRGHASVRWTAMRVQTALRNNTWIKDIDIKQEEAPKTLDLTMINAFKVPPLDYQLKLLKEYDWMTYRLKLNGVLVDWVMGSGKSIGGLLVAECAKTDKVVVICPKNAINNVWVNTIQTKMVNPPSIWTSDSPRPYRNEKYIIIHNEAIGNYIEMVKDLASKKVLFAVIVDECHNFNEMSSKRTLEMIAMVKASRTRHALLQSGSMFKAVGSEIVAAMYAIDPTFDEDLAERFKRLYSASATEALKLLQYRLGFFTSKVVKEQVGLDAPDTATVLVQTPDATRFTLAAVSDAMRIFLAERMSYYDSRKDDDYKEYERIMRMHLETLTSKEAHAAFRDYQGDVAIVKRGDLMNCRDEIKATNLYENTQIMPFLSPEDKKIFQEVKTIYKYVVLKIQGECLGKVLGRYRIDACVSIAKAFDYSKYIESTEKKTLIYTNYIESLLEAEKVVKNLGYDPLSVHGATNKDIIPILKNFESKPEMNPLLATFKSLSTAVPLTTADTMVMLDLPWRDYIYSQTVARIHRLGKDSKVRIFICKLDTGSEPNITSRTMDILQWSQAQIFAITGVKSPFEIDEKNIAVEAYAMLREPMNLVDGRLEENFMAPLI